MKSSLLSSVELLLLPVIPLNDSSLLLLYLLQLGALTMFLTVKLLLHSAGKFSVSGVVQHVKLLNTSAPP